MTLLEVFCHIDDFCQTFQIPTPKLSLPGIKSTRQRSLCMTPSEIMTVLVQLSWTKRHVCLGPTTAPSGLGRLSRTAPHGPARLAGLSAPFEPLPRFQGILLPARLCVFGL